MSNCNDGGFNLNKSVEKKNPFTQDTDNRIFVFGVGVCLLLTLSLFASFSMNNLTNEVYATVVSGQNITGTLTQNVTVGETPETPDINAKHIFDTKTAVLGNDVKNLIILIPDEAHHGNGETKENRFIE